MITVSLYQVLKLDGVTIDDIQYCDLLEEHYICFRGINYTIDQYTLPQTNDFVFTVVLVESPQETAVYGTGVVRSIKSKC